VAHYPTERTETLETERDGETVQEKRKLTGEYTRGQKVAIFDASSGVMRDRTVRFSQVDKTGVERIVTDQTYDHKGSWSNKPPEGNVLSALNSIRRIAEHGIEQGRFIALCDNDIVLVLNQVEVWTAVKRANAKDALWYYNKNAIKSTEKVIKWERPQKGQSPSTLERITSFFRRTLS
jgi:hypothetical protein